MANTKISDLGPEIALSADSERRASALGNGSLKPGQIVYVDPSTGKVAATQAGTNDYIVGILDKGYKTTIDEAIGDGDPCSIIIPQSGHLYRIFCTDPSGAVPAGSPHKLSTTAGSIEGAANTDLNTAGNIAVNTKALASGDTVGEFRWL